MAGRGLGLSKVGSGKDVLGVDSGADRRTQSEPRRAAKCTRLFDLTSTPGHALARVRMALRVDEVVGSCNS